MENVIKKAKHDDNKKHNEALKVFIDMCKEEDIGITYDDGELIIANPELVAKARTMFNRAYTFIYGEAH